MVKEVTEQSITASRLKKRLPGSYFIVTMTGRPPYNQAQAVYHKKTLTVYWAGAVFVYQNIADPFTALEQWEYGAI